MKRNQYILYGLAKYEETINQIINDLNIFHHSFDIKLILTEALTNAFKHGNKNDISKPIYLRYIYDGIKIKFEIQDSGEGLENVIIPEEVLEENVLSDGGRGLFLIQSLAEKIEFKKNILIIKKYLTVEQ